MLFVGDGGGHRSVVGRRAGGEVKEPFGADHGGLEVDAVDGEEVGIEVGLVVEEPRVARQVPYEAAVAFPAALSSLFMWSKNSLVTELTMVSKFSCVMASRS